MQAGSVTAAVDPAVLVDALLDNGFGPFTGVPCSFLGPVISCLEDRHTGTYVTAANEGEAVAIAAGTRLAGRRPVVILQNSGLGNTVNPLTSLCHTLRIPVLLLVTWRGEPGRPDEPQHELMGRITPDLLSAMEIRHEPLPGEVSLPERLAVATEHMEATGLPFAFIVPKGSVAPYRDGPASPSRGTGTMLREEAIRHVMGGLGPRALVVATTGKTARELERDWDRPENLYVVGSMGCASSVALGVALGAPDRRVVVLDGDGAALMRLEAMATIGHRRPANLLHVLLDNEAYESTGAQATTSASVDFAAIASACGYASTADVADAAALQAAVASPAPGPRLIRVRISAGSSPSLGRPALAPPASAQRFRRAVTS
ncbi:thiamine pyrophosphate enzyme [Lentzea sp. NBRC 105346]|uniref:phosphonopyruvate decarboxylase n=1 Tax=Lentzea sp. NBRC 105346 TaxID=3032205 RepID=UPI0024A3BB03|nr:phosphonopyruvate decarboxylase [Lentzea sp. NBRC 105346]GLZ29246.1 thiamine pyrophosphate enzyme [Lentzea sp. NBRC 105346]